MSALDTLTDRIRSEFRELPGLKITFEQARRLWHSNDAQCLAALEALIGDGFLTRSASGAFIARPRPQGQSVKAMLPRRTGGSAVPIVSTSSTAASAKD